MLITSHNQLLLASSVDEVVNNSYSLEKLEDQKFIKEVAQSIVIQLTENKPIFMNNEIHHLLKKEYSVMNNLIEQIESELPNELKIKAKTAFKISESGLIDTVLDKIKRHRPLSLLTLQEFIDTKHKIDITLKAITIASQVCELNHVYSIHSPFLLIKECESTFQLLKELTPFIEKSLQIKDEEKSNIPITPTIH